ncbi:LysR family transcriptional regulator [Cupriavidus basilensis]|uniref:LysR family transcriptional regulator n=1 Tax=Cupriavidus basilensis TaxID=68895 RepID=UPI0039F7308A
MATVSPSRVAAARAAHPNRIDRLRIRHLRLLDLVARTGSLTAAAEVMHISQPAVTKMLQELEQAFGCTLIERTTRGGRLSPAGERALERLRIALGALDAASEALAARPEIPLVRMGVLPLVGVNVLPRLVATLSQQGVLPRLQVREHTVSGLLGLLASGELDCVIGRLETGHPAQPRERLAITPLWDEHLAVACARDHPLARRREVSLPALHEGPWILPPRGTHTREIFEQPFLDSGQLPPVPHIESISFHSSLSMVAASGFLTVAPASAVRHYGETSMVHQVRLRTPFASGRMVFITQRDAAVAPAVTLIADALRQAGNP